LFPVALNGLTCYYDEVSNRPNRRVFWTVIFFGERVAETELYWVIINLVSGLLHFVRNDGRGYPPSTGVDGRPQVVPTVKITDA